MSYITNLKCRECGQEYPISPLHVCETCFGPLEVAYDYARIRAAISRSVIERRPHNLWRYRELLPVDGEPEIGPNSGFTPLVQAERLGAELGLRSLYIKDDTVNHPTLSYKDRVVSVAISKAREFGFTTVSCASTGNLATAVAAHAARAGLKCVIFMPEGVEAGKIVGSTIYGAQVITIRGNYDDVNRLCSEIADKYGWAFVNINLRPYYTEGAKTFGFEVAEQLGWRLPDHIVVPTAGGTILPKVAKAFKEFKEVGLLRDGEVQDPLRAGGRLGAGDPRAAQGHRPDHAGQAQHHREVDRDRKSGRRLLRAEGGARIRRMGRRGERSRDHRRDQTARAHRGNFRRACRRHHARGHEEAHRAGPHQARRDAWWSRSPATDTKPSKRSPTRSSSRSSSKRGSRNSMRCSSGWRTADAANRGRRLSASRCRAAEA